MSYKVSFKNRSVIYVNSEQGEKLKSIFSAGSDVVLNIGSNSYRTSQIVSIETGKDPNHVDPWADKSRQIESKQCRGVKSIQKEINHIIKHDNPKSWARKIQDRQHREIIRNDLRNIEGAEWCDQQLQDCFC